MTTRTTSVMRALEKFSRNVSSAAELRTRSPSPPTCRMRTSFVGLAAIALGGDDRAAALSLSVPLDRAAQPVTERRPRAEAGELFGSGAVDVGSGLPVWSGRIPFYIPIFTD